ncbi:MAG TPA: UbiA family prenyltransferase [Candidatus Paceibacterota bacterium]|nr:UbiA family prenyltransferase [Candidatus Paceibacterota bacterium]
MRLRELEDIRDATVILDIDGTLTLPGSSEVAAETATAIEALRSRNDVYLLSNRGDRERDAAVARALRVLHIDTPYRKPSIRTLRGIKRTRPLLVVVGDKVLTDGLLALFARARFVRVRRVAGEHDSFLDRFAHAADDAAGHAWHLARLLRPLQWAKNALVFAPLFFAREFLDAPALQATVAVFFAFSFIASAGYVVNDLLDAPADRAHRHKRRRPLASGDLRAAEALGLCAMLLAAAALLLYAYAPLAMSVAALYFISSLAYSISLKRVALLELVLFMWFYFARVLGGSLASGVPLSSWLILAIMFLSLFFAAAKRYAQKKGGGERLVLERYPERFLEGLLFLSAGLVVAFYALYSILGVSSAFAAYSTVPVMAAVLRYLQLAFTRGEAEYPEKLLFSDPGLRLAFLAWFILMLAVFY